MKLLMKYGSVIIIILVLISSTFACITIKIPSKNQTPTSNQNQTSTGGPKRPHPPVRTGTITTGTRVDLGTQTISTAGGTLSISKPGGPLDGFTIAIPPKSYSDSRTFKVSSAPITNQTFGTDINPVSPMITVDSGSGYSGEILYVRVPVKVPNDHFAMGFIYDDKTKQLEGIPLVGKDSESVTIATRHFSNLFISMIEKALLKKDIDSGFRPGIDDWQFTNYGSYIAPGGHCEGQSLTAMWYYCTQPDGKDLCLYGRYDNNGNKPETPNLWQDDSLGYRLCSIAQEDWSLNFADEFWLNLSGKSFKYVNNKWELVDAPGLDDETRYNLFAYSIMATNEPQFVRIRGEGAHTMVVYKIIGNALYVADPNYPGNTDRKIIYYSGDGKFKPYQSGANKAEIEKGNSESYSNIEYYAKSTLVTWDKIPQRWTEFKNKTIGNDKFPSVKPLVQDNNNWIPADGYIAKDKKIRISPFSNPSSDIYRDGEKLVQDGGKKFELKPGDNKLGIWMYYTQNNEKLYIDFQYITIKYGDEECKTPPPANVMAKLQQTTRFRCELLNLPTTIIGSGSMNKWVPGFKFTKHFYVPGNAIQSGGDGAMPITWSGTSFSGGGSKEYPDRLNGSVCYSNGQVLVSFDYTTNNPADNLKMSVKNLPCDPNRLLKPAAGGRPELIYMNTDAPVVKGFVTRLEWTSHEERARYGSPTPDVWDASLTAADWSNKCGFDIFIY